MRAAMDKPDFLDVKYILEAHVGVMPVHDSGYPVQSGQFSGGSEVVKSFILLDVDRVSVVKMPSTRRTWTLGTLPVKESEGYRQHRIFVSGSSGFGIRGGSSHDGSWIRQLSGKARFDELKLFLDWYESECAKYRSATRRNSSKAPWMVFRRIWEGDAYVVDNIQLNELRDVGRHKFTAGYDLQMMTEFRIDGDGSKYTQGLVGAGVRTSEEASSAWSDIVNNSLQASNEAASQTGTREVLSGPDPMLKYGGSGMIGTVSGMKSYLKETFRGGQVGRDVYDAALKFSSNASSLSEMVIAASGRFDMNFEAFRSVAMDATGMTSIKRFFDSSKSLSDSIRGAISSVSGGDLLGQASAYRSLLSAVESFDALARDALGGFVSFSGNEVRPVASSDSRVEIVSSGPSDSASTLATRFLGSPDRYEDIMVANGMLDPWTMWDGRPVTSGVMVSIPSDDGLVSGPETASLLGTDLKFSFEDGDFEVSGGTYAFVSGDENIMQSLRNRSVTPQGQLRLRPEFGLPKIPDVSHSMDTTSHAASAVMSSYRQDPRVKTVKNVVLSIDADVTSISVDVTIVGGMTVPVSVPLSE